MPLGSKCLLRGSGFRIAENMQLVHQILGPSGRWVNPGAALETLNSSGGLGFRVGKPGILN